MVATFYKKSWKWKWLEKYFIRNILAIKNLMEKLYVGTKILKNKLYSLGYG